MSPDGNVYVADSDNARVQSFSLTGQFVTKWGVVGEGPGEFDTPEGIAVDPLGRIFVSDVILDRIESFTFAPTAVHATTWGAVKAMFAAGASR